MYGGKASGGEQHLIAGEKWADSGDAPTYWTAAGWAYRRHTCGFSSAGILPRYFILSSIKYFARPVACEVFASEAQGRWDDTVSKARGEGR